MLALKSVPSAAQSATTTSFGEAPRWVRAILSLVASFLLTGILLATSASAQYNDLAHLDIDLTVDKAKPDSGQTVIFKFKVTNDGPKTTKNAWLWFDTYDPEGCFEPTSITSAGVNIGDPAGTPVFQIHYGVPQLPIEWKFAKIQKDEMSILTVEGKIKCGDEFWFTGVGKVKENGTAGDYNPEEPQVVEVHNKVADLVLDVTVDNPTPKPHKTVNFVVSLKNLGPDRTKNVRVLIDTYDPDGCFELTPLITTDGGTLTEDSQLPTVWKKTFNVGDSLNVYVTGKTVCGSDFSLVANVFDDGTAVDPSHEVAQADVDGPGNADLALTKEMVDYDAKTGITKFLVTVMNMGPKPATWIAIKEQFDPLELEFIDAIPSSGNYSAASRRWEIEKLLRGDSATMMIKFKCLTGVEAKNHVKVEWLDQFDPNPDNDKAWATAVKLDFGDAPASYKTLLKDDGARHHLIKNKPFIGFAINIPPVGTSMPDADNDGQLSPLGLGDDQDGNDDEWANLLFEPPPGHNLRVRAGRSLSLPVPVTGAGYLNLWMDFNGDGDWDDWGEHVTNDLAMAAPGALVPVNVPMTAVHTDESYGRFRFCTATNECNTYYGEAKDGEVEDFRMAIESLDFGDLYAPPVFPIPDNAASHAITGKLWLGDMIDAEEAEQKSTTIWSFLGEVADGDDNDGMDDEDGIEFLTSVFLDPVPPGVPISDPGFIQGFVPGTTVSIVVRVSGNVGGYFSGWIDYNPAFPAQPADFTQPGDQIKNDLWLDPGDNLVTFTVPNGAGSTSAQRLAGVRFRICSMAEVCNKVFGPALDGEVEDYSVLIGRKGDPVMIQTDEQLGFIVPDPVLNGRILVKNKEEELIFKGKLGDLGKITVKGRKGDDLLFVDPDAFDKDDLVVDLLGGFDDLILANPSDPTDAVKHYFDSPTDGSIEIMQGTMSKVLFYRGLSPIVDHIVAPFRQFVFNGAGETIVIKDDEIADDKYSFIDSELAEEVTFRNATDSIRVEAGPGNDIIEFQGLDAKGRDQNNYEVTLEGDIGADRFVVTPHEKLRIAVRGDHPLMCFGDVLDIAAPEDGWIDEIDEMGGGMGTITFENNIYKPVTFNGIEGLADYKTDLALTAVVDPGWKMFYPGDEIEVTLRVTNLGNPHKDDLQKAQCVAVKDVLDDDLSIFEGPILSGEGMFLDGNWIIRQLVPGQSETFRARAIVNSLIPGPLDAQMVMSDAKDVEPWNDTAFLGNIKETFPFPAKAAPVSVVFSKNSVGLERMVVGLFQGTPGINASVICRVPDPVDGMGMQIYEGYNPVGLGNRWRPCTDGLPFPLNVTDLYVDDMDTPGNFDDDRIWLTSWGNAGLYYSDNGGVTWFASEPEVGTPMGWAAVYAITQDVDNFMYISANNGLVFRSLDRGLTWQEVGKLPQASADTPWSLMAHPTEPGVIYAGTFGYGVLVSSDYGFTWEVLEGNDLLLANTAGHIFDLEFDPDTKTLFAGTGQGVYRMRFPNPKDVVGVKEWEFIDITFDPNVDARDGRVEVRDLSFDMNKTLYAATWGFGVFKNELPTMDQSGGIPMPFTEFALRGQQVNFVAVSPNGYLVMGMSTGISFSELAAANTATAIEEEIVRPEAELPEGFALQQNYPNPFNPVTTIGFALPESSQARLAVYDVLGREVSVLADGRLHAGEHRVTFDAAGLPTGTYIYRLHTAAGTISKTLVLMK